MSAPEFDWADEECVVLHHQPAIAVYPNNMGTIVIRQERHWDQDEDTIIITASLDGAEAVAQAMAVMSVASLLRNATGHKSHDLYERTFNKLARTFTAQMAALKNHRSPHGQQKMVVEHVNVHEGGQAIVGQVDRDRGQA
jgi:hypothetical protein